MKKLIFSLLVFFFNIVPIYALSFKMEPSFNSKTVSVGEAVNIDVYINDISDTSSGISACALKITADDGITINEGIKTYGNWQGMLGKKGYSFDTIDVVLTSTKIFTISVIVNQSGNVNMTDIVCTDSDDIQNTSANKTISFIIENKSSSSSQPSSSAMPSSSASSKPSSSKPSSSSQPAASSSSKPSTSSQSASSSSSSSSAITNDETKVYLNDIIVTGGVINFNKEIFEYNIMVDDYDDVSVKCVVELIGSDTCSVSESLEDDLKNFVITVWNKDGKSQKYILYLTKKLMPESSNNTLISVGNEKKDYSGIFIVLIIILILVNVGRIGYNYYLQNKK